jgi:hypothetical protein
VGRNVFDLVGYSTSDARVTTSESLVNSALARVLRFKPFTDLSIYHWAVEPVALCVTLDMVNGYPDNTFQPEKGITRAELVTMLVRTLSVKLAKTAAYTGFKDVPAKSWAAPYIAYGVYKKFTTGYPDKTFRPNQVISRAEGITLLARYAELVQLAPLESPFPDLKTDFWANKYIGPAQDTGMLKYLEGKDFEPDKPFTRAEACEVLYRTPQVKEKVETFWNTGELSSKKIYVAPAAGPEETPSFFMPTGITSIEEVGTFESY